MAGLHHRHVLVAGRILLLFTPPARIHMWVAFSCSYCMRRCLGTASRFVAAASAGVVWMRDVLTVVCYSNRILCSPQLRGLTRAKPCE